MKNVIVSVFLFIYFLTSAQQDPLRAELDKIIEVAQSTSVYRDRVDWPQAKDSIYALAKNVTQFAQLKPALNYLLEVLGDEHGRVFYNNQVIAYYYSGELKEHQAGFDPVLYGQVQSGQPYTFEALLLRDHIGYIRMPGLPMGDNMLMAKNIQDQVCELIAKGADRWLIDLRYNGGGNLNPMVEGLTAILGDGPVGGAAGLTTADNLIWEIRDGDFYNDGYSILLPEECSGTSAQRVAVLTSLYTVSSGEALAVIFKGRDQTRFFGARTLGMVTGTSWDVISDSVTVSISTNFYMDRNGKVYRHYVDVDEEIQSIHSPEMTDEPCILRAIQWIEQD